jgi:GNAT superfamily N-acetyltransferase
MAVQIQPLNSNHEFDSFDCGEPALNSWLLRQGGQHQRKGYGRVFVAVDLASPNPNSVKGFYSLNAAQIEGKRYRRQYPEKVPAISLGRLAVDLQYQGQGLGAHLLVNAMERSLLIADDLGVACLAVHAKDDKAAQFYERFSFIRCQDDQLDLFLPIATIAQLLSP